MFRSPVWHPLAGSRPCQAAFGRYNETFRVRMERFCDKQFARLRPVRIRRIDQIHTEFDGASENLERVLPIGRPTPDALPGNTHRAKTEPVDCKVAIQFPSSICGHFRCRWRLSCEDYVGFPGPKRRSTRETHPNKCSPGNAAPLVRFRKFIFHRHEYVREKDCHRKELVAFARASGLKMPLRDLRRK